MWGKGYGTQNDQGCLAQEVDGEDASLERGECGPRKSDEGDFGVDESLE